MTSKVLPTIGVLLGFYEWMIIYILLKRLSLLGKRGYVYLLPFSVETINLLRNPIFFLIENSLKFQQDSIQIIQINDQCFLTFINLG